MRVKKRIFLIWGIGLLSAGIALFATIADGFQPDPDLIIPIALAYIVLGGLIAIRNPENAIGWIFLVAIFILSVGEAMRWYANLSLQLAPDMLPAADVIATLMEVTDDIGYELLFIFPFLLFPNGRLISRRWLPLLWFAVLALVLQFLEIFHPGPLVTYPSWDNPLGIEQLVGYFEFSGTINSIFTITLFVICPIYLILRYRWSPRIERQQIKWIAFAASFISIGLLFLSLFSEPLADIAEIVIGIIIIASLPLAIAIAILRYNLWDIDLIIRRTLQYTLVTGLLALVYFGTILLLQNLFVGVTGQGSQIVIVISTLTIATLFNPLRTRVQDFIDRRFYRKKYNAEQALTKFAVIARDEVDIDRLTTSLLGVVEETIQPETTSLWMISYNDR